VIPYHDENQTQRTPIVTIALIVITTLTWIVVQGAGSALAVARSVCDLGLIPGELTETVPPGTSFPIAEGLLCLTDPGPQISHLFTSMFLHGSWMHLIGNMWFLWLFGNNIEDAMTRSRFVAFYILCGLAAAITQVAADPMSAVPMVGASGAISGVMGAYLVLFPRVRVYTIIPLGFYPYRTAVSAWVMLIYWAFLQFAGGITSVVGGESGGVAFWAHLGGFVAGVVLIKVFVRRDRVAAHVSGRWSPREAGWR
jgi:membrane associated rhomboid family serine protease